MHAVCLDTYPPIIYLTDVSRDIIRMVHEINNQFDTKKVSWIFLFFDPWYIKKYISKDNNK